MKTNQVTPGIAFLILVMVASWCTLAYEIIWGDSWKIAIVALMVNLSAAEPVRRNRR